jgi:hypothetical protein
MPNFTGPRHQAFKAKPDGTMRLIDATRWQLLKTSAEIVLFSLQRASLEGIFVLVCSFVMAKYWSMVMVMQKQTSWHMPSQII